MRELLALAAFLVVPAIVERVIVKARPLAVRPFAVRLGRDRRIPLTPAAEGALRANVGGDYRTAPARVVDLGALDAAALDQAAAVSFRARAHLDAERALLAIVPEHTFGKNDSLWAYFLDLRVEDGAIVAVPRFYFGGVLAKLASAFLSGVVTRSVEVALAVLGVSFVLVLVQAVFNAFHLRWLPDAAEGLVASALPRAELGASEPIRVGDVTPPLREAMEDEEPASASESDRTAGSSS